MRAFRTSLAAVTLFGLAPLAASAYQAQPSALLDFKPTIKGVEYDIPADKAAVDGCKVEEVKGPDGKSFIGWALRDSQGKLLRRFMDTNGKKTQRGKETKASTHLDQWSYYLDGFEVYRESDLDEDGHVDEVRWLNSGGTRVAAMKYTADGYRLAGWKQISAEEASKVLVQGIISGELDMIASVLASPQELQEVGAPKSVTDHVTKTATNRPALVAALRKSVAAKGWNGATVWSRFDGGLPHIIPADSTLGVAKDVVLYENSVIFAQPANPGKTAGTLAYLQASDAVKIGETWKFTDVPVAIDPEHVENQNFADNSIRGLIFGNGGPPVDPTQDPELVAALKLLDEHDKKHAPGPDASKKEIAEYNIERIKLLQKVIAVAKKPEDRLTYQKEAVNSLTAAYQTELYPGALAIIDGLIAKEGGKLASYATYHKILAEFDLEANQPGADFLAVQKKMMVKLEKFRSEFPTSEETGDALYQMATVSEFNSAQEDAERYYKELGDKFPNTDFGKKAVGALRRLDLVGKSLTLSGTSASGKTIGTANYKGKTLLVIFWSSSAEVFRKDAAELNKLLAKYQPKGFEILGVNLDTDKAAYDAFQKEHPLSWAQIVEPGGMESRLANEFGILASPTMILVDSTGKVVSRGVKTVGELERHLEKLLSGGSNLSLGDR